MRTLLTLITLIGMAGTTPAQVPANSRTFKEPAYAFMPPSVALATAMGDKGEIRVEVRVTKLVTVCEPIEAIKTIDGKEVKTVETATKTKSVSIMEVRKHDLTKEGTSVVTTQGIPIKLEEAIQRLAKPTPVLISQGGPPDPYHLQTTKPETPIIIVPMAPPQPVAPMPSGNSKAPMPPMKL